MVYENLHVCILDTTVHRSPFCWRWSDLMVQRMNLLWSVMLVHEMVMFMHYIGIVRALNS